MNWESDDIFVSYSVLLDLSNAIESIECSVVAITKVFFRTNSDVFVLV